MIDHDKLDKFLEGLLPKQEEDQLRRDIERSPEAREILAQKALEKAVEEEIERDFWNKELQKIQAEEATPTIARRSITRRLYTISAIAASALILVTAGWFFFLRPPGEGIRSIGDIDRQLLTGDWSASVAQSDNSSLLFQLSLLNNNGFNLEVTLLKSNQQGQGDKIKAKGTYTIEKDQLQLLLDQRTIEKSATADLFNAAAIEQWLKTKELFREPLTVIRLTEDELIIQYGNADGLTWTKNQ